MQVPGIEGGSNYLGALMGTLTHRESPTGKKANLKQLLQDIQRELRRDPLTPNKGNEVLPDPITGIKIAEMLSELTGYNIIGQIEGITPSVPSELNRVMFNIRVISQRVRGVSVTVATQDPGVDIVNIRILNKTGTINNCDLLPTDREKLSKFAEQLARPVHTSLLSF